MRSSLLVDGFLDAECERRIVVDDFDTARLRLSNCALAQRPLFFLTHAHADHLRGLSAEWDFAPIHMSDVTRALVLGRFKGFRRPELLCAAAVGERLTLPLPGADADAADLVSVTFLPANHIAGAVMLLFEWRDAARGGAVRSVLHTGDFRYAPKMDDFAVLLERERRIDQLVLDSTFVGAVWRHLPTRAESIDEVLRLVDAHLRRHGAAAQVFLGCDNLGYEPLFEALFERFGKRICVPSVLWLQLQDILRAQHQIGQVRDDAADVRAGIAARRAAGYTYRDADCARVDVYTRYADETSFFVVPFQLCADAARAARLDTASLTGELPPIVRARGTQRLKRRARLVREGRASSPTLLAIESAGRAALDDAAHERAAESSSEADEARAWMPSTHVDRATGVPTPLGAAETLRSMHEKFVSGTGLLMQVSTQFFRDRHCRKSEKHEGVWRVLYSNHSSRTEIERFVRLVQPRTVRPLLRDIAPHDLAWLQSHCAPSSQRTDDVIDDDKSVETERTADEADNAADDDDGAADDDEADSATESILLMASRTMRGAAAGSLVTAAVDIAAAPPVIVLTDDDDDDDEDKLIEVESDRSVEHHPEHKRRRVTASQLSQQRRRKFDALVRFSPLPLSPHRTNGSQQSSVSEIDDLVLELPSVPRPPPFVEE
jgi:glyoxylase-like metal-dependent hydrolase (beta-lactamase superfamily II)